MKTGRPKIPIAERFWPRVATGGPDDCWLWTGGCYSNGYGRITKRVITRGHREMGLTHRVAWELTNGPITPDVMLCHTCDVRYPAGDTTYRRCCNPAHVRPGDALINMHDAITSQRLHTRGDKRGEKSGQAKLTEAQVREIRARYAAGESNAVLARAYGLTTTGMHGVVSGKGWAHIPIGDAREQNRANRLRTAEERHQRLHDLHAEGLTYAQIAEREGISTARVGQLLSPTYRRGQQL